MAMRYKVNGKLVEIENDLTFKDHGTISCLCCDESMLIRTDKRNRYYLTCPACGTRLVSRATEPILFFLIRRSEDKPGSLQLKDPSLIVAIEEMRRALRAGERMKSR